MKNLLFGVPEYTIDFRLNEGDPGSLSFFPCAHHLQGHCLETVELHIGISANHKKSSC